MHVKARAGYEPILFIEGDRREPIGVVGVVVGDGSFLRIPYDAFRVDHVGIAFFANSRVTPRKLLVKVGYPDRLHDMGCMGVHPSARSPIPPELDWVLIPLPVFISRPLPLCVSRDAEAGSSVVKVALAESSSKRCSVVPVSSGTGAYTNERLVLDHDEADLRATGSVGALGCHREGDTGAPCLDAEGRVGWFVQGSIDGHGWPGPGSTRNHRLTPVTDEFVAIVRRAVLRKRWIMKGAYIRAFWCDQYD
jgi:hypothetical protein